MKNIKEVQYIVYAREPKTDKFRLGIGEQIADLEELAIKENLAICDETTENLHAR